MTPLKFRAWDTKQSKMIDLYKFTPLALDAGLNQDGVFIPFADNLIVMQSTGLTDKNGKEIFEGDVFQWSFAVDTYKGEVKWWLERAGFGLPSMLAKARNGFMLLSDKIAMEGEVIGNIHENPEFLPSEK